MYDALGNASESSVNADPEENDTRNSGQVTSVPAVANKIKQLHAWRIWTGLALYVALTIIIVPFVTIDVNDANRQDTKVPIEGVIDTLYFVVVTLSTVGYGDLSPVT